MRFGEGHFLISVRLLGVRRDLHMIMGRTALSCLNIFHFNPNEPVSDHMKVLVPRSYFGDNVGPRFWYQNLGSRIFVLTSWYQDLGTKTLVLNHHRALDPPSSP